jgi:hypothetical protein
VSLGDDAYELWVWEPGNEVSHEEWRWLVRREVSFEASRVLRIGSVSAQDVPHPDWSVVSVLSSQFSAFELNPGLSDESLASLGALVPASPGISQCTIQTGG